MSIKIEKHPNSGPSKGKAKHPWTSWKWAKVSVAKKNKRAPALHSGQHDAPPKKFESRIVNGKCRVWEDSMIIPSEAREHMARDAGLMGRDKFVDEIWRLRRASKRTPNPAV